MKIAVVGRGDSAKKFAKFLAETQSNLSLAPIKTTDKSADTEHFEIVEEETIQKAEENAFPFFYIENSHLYYLEQSDIDENNVFVVTPGKLKEFMDSMPSTPVITILLETEEPSEKDAYTLLHEELDKDGIEDFPENCCCVRYIKNNFGDTSEEAIRNRAAEAKAVSNTIRTHENLIRIVKDGIRNKYIAMKENNEIPIMTLKPGDENPTEKSVSIEQFANYMMTDAASDMFHIILTRYLSHIELPKT